MNTVRTPFVLAVAALVLSLAAVAVAAAKPNPHADLDCNFCHFDTPRFGVDTRDTVTFWRAERDEPQLCERCHGPESNFHPLGVVPGPERLGTRTPEHLPLGRSEAVRGQVVCVSCHFLHAADADRALLRGFPGADEPRLFDVWQDLCRECHAGGLEKRSPHAGDERACAFCHSTKPSPARRRPSPRRGASSASSATATRTRATTPASTPTRSRRSAWGVTTRTWARTTPRA